MEASVLKKCLFFRDACLRVMSILEMCPYSLEMYALESFSIIREMSPLERCLSREVCLR